MPYEKDMRPVSRWGKNAEKQGGRGEKKKKKKTKIEQRIRGVPDGCSIGQKKGDWEADIRTLTPKKHKTKSTYQGWKRKDSFKHLVILRVVGLPAKNQHSTKG